MNNNIIIIAMFLLSNSIQKAFTRKIVGFTSPFNPKYNPVLGAIDERCNVNYCSPKGVLHYSTVNSFFELSKQNYINKKMQLLFSNEQTKTYLQQNEFIKDKKIISISPGGYKGFYLMGVSTYIKDNYSLEPFIFSGASAGAWTALFLTFNKEPLDVVVKIIDKSIKNAQSISEMEHIMKYKILNTYTTEDFDLKRLFIGVTSLSNFKVKTNIYSDFDDLEDALNCCIASSHIPYVTGGFTNRYNNIYAFDGGFSNYPYLDVAKPVLHITPSMWNSKNGKGQISDYTTLFSREKYDFLELFDAGYNDAKKNKDFLDAVLLAGNPTGL
jgi:hypothetical protein